MKNTIMTVKNCQVNECKAMALYFYRLLEEIENLHCHEETQILFNELIKKLDLEKHAERVMDSFINRLVKQKKLTPIKQMENRRARLIFDTKKMPDRIFKEDETIYENCGNFTTTTQRDVKLIRCIFSGNESNFHKLAGCIFFTSSSPDKEYTIPSRINISSDYLQAAGDHSNIKFLKDSLRLSEEEAELLCCSYRTNAVKEFYDTVNDLSQDDKDRISIYAKELNKQKKEIRKLLARQEKLHSFGLISDSGEFEYDAMACIESQDLNVYFADIIKKQKNEKTFLLDSFNIKPEKTSLAQRLLKNESPCNLLFYGAPGSGKTEYAKALAKASGLKPMVYKNELEVKNNTDDNENENALFRLNCLLSVKQKNSIIIVDEAESVLKTIGYGFFGMDYMLPRKGTVNKMLENSENKVIWIMNYTKELDESTLRRFTWSLHFNDMSSSMLRSIAAEKLKKISMPESLRSKIIDLFGQYHVTGSSIDNMAKTLKGMDCTAKNADRVLMDVKEVLEANSTLIFGKEKMRQLVNSSYDLSVLNTSIPAEEILQMVTAAAEYEEKERNNQSGIRMLFYGASGTGKTELVRYLAEKLNKKILLKRASDIMGKYVGENEKNIRDTFEEAEANNEILLFDEADSFFADRENAHTSWERTMVNEFLTQMEEFSGILICTTNLRKIMDPAMERRFHIMTEFKPLEKNGIETLMKKFFSDYRFTSEQLKKITSFETVTPGDFGSLNSKLRFVPQEKKTCEYIINSLVNLQKEKKTAKTIGF